MDRGMLTGSDLGQLEEREVAPEEIQRQLELFREPPGYTRLVRPCTFGDGIVRLAEREIPALHELHAEASRSGRFLKFVPASGAASRMFRDLLHFQHGPGRDIEWTGVVGSAASGDDRARALVDFIEQLERFPFREKLSRVLAARGEKLERLAAERRHREILDGLLGAEGLDYDALAKGLIEFHAYPGGSRTPFEEHLVEAAGHVRDGDGRCRLHFTVSIEHREPFQRLLAAVRERYERRYGARFEIGFSTQKPSTDTVAVDGGNRPLRDPAGRLLFRPGGHGALIENLADLEADLVYIKNIDNVQPDHRKPAVVDWKRTLGGYLVRLQHEIGRRLRRLGEQDLSAEGLAETIRFVGSRLQVDLDGHLDPLSPASRRAWLLRKLNRPLRVCGVVPNTGEPGGGPFWVRGRDGSISLQIVEGAQIDPHDVGQQEIVRGSTHFNPVDLVCAVRDIEGRPFDLATFIDPDAVMISQKTAGGKALKALERPGLWNGAMADWITVFVEIPLTTFSPVKTVLDLLREEHQPPR